MTVLVLPICIWCAIKFREEWEAALMWHCWMASLKSCTETSLKLPPSLHLHIWRRQGWRIYVMWNFGILVFSGEAMFLLFCILHLLLFQNIISPKVTSPKQLWNVILAMIAMQSTLVTQGEESTERDGEAADAGSSPLGQMEKRSNKGALPCLISWAINNKIAFFRSQISSSDPQGRKQWLHIQIYETCEREWLQQWLPCRPPWQQAK